MTRTCFCIGANSFFRYLFTKGGIFAKLFILVAARQPAAVEGVGNFCVLLKTCKTDLILNQISRFDIIFHNRD
jgi:hypothetical protein